MRDVDRGIINLGDQHGCLKQVNTLFICLKQCGQLIPDEAAVKLLRRLPQFRRFLFQSLGFGVEMPQGACRSFTRSGDSLFSKSAPQIGLGDQRLAKRRGNRSRIILNFYAQLKIPKTGHRVSKLGQAGPTTAQPAVTRFKNQMTVDVTIKLVAFVAHLQPVPVTGQVMSRQPLV